jgi:hypothetical protein
MNKFLDRYIQGEPGSWFFCIELIWGRQISGGQFYRRSDARRALLNRLTEFLDDPEIFLSSKKVA